MLFSILIGDSRNQDFQAWSLCPLYAKEEWVGKKLYYRQIKYITSNTENFKVYLQINRSIYI